MLRAQETNDETYVSDFTLLDQDGDHDNDDLEIIPSDLREKSQTSYFDWREAESVYVFEKNTKDDSDNKLVIRPIFKRFTPENSPPTLYNHGFENMESVGALYSRASSDIFGDWNACGKVMGLAPWTVHSWKTDSETIAPRREKKPILSGSLYSEQPGASLQIDYSLMTGTPRIARNDPELFDEEGNFLSKRRYDFDDGVKGNNDESSEGSTTEYLLPTKTALDAIMLASRIQIDLETVVMDFVKYFKAKTGESNLCLAGGVALNSVLNGRLARELDFEQTYIPPYPGDDGIAVGCCAYALYGPKQPASETSSSPRPPLWKQPLSPYLGPEYTEDDIKMAIEDAAPWLEVDTVRNEDRRVDLMAQEVESGGVVAWFQGRSELGPRALGHRSILADPRKKGLVRFINQYVKKRESFRPFAPSALAEEAHEWFDLDPNVVKDNNVSPYMSMTAFVKEDKREQIPAVTHVDGSSRLQTVTKEAEPLYHKFISKFF
jgi:carbamoyltransferase